MLHTVLAENRDALPLPDPGILQRIGKLHAARLDVTVGVGDLFLGQAVGDAEGDVEAELVGVAHRGERRDGDEAAVALGELLALPHLVEEDFVGVVGQGRGEFAERLLADWNTSIAAFVKVMPTDFKRVLEAAAAARAEGRDETEAVMAAARV